MVVENSNLEILKFDVALGDKRVIEIPVKGNDDIHFIIPADTDFQTTIHFRVKKEKLTKLQHKQQMRKFGFTVHTVIDYIGDEFEPRDEAYVVLFEKDHSPLGMVLKGKFSCTSTYIADGKVLFDSPWKLTII